MMLIRSLLLTGMALSMSTTALCAADYFILPVKPGPVAGTPLAAVSLRSKDTQSRLPVIATETRLQTNINQRGNTAGKWLKVGQQPEVTVVTPTTVAPTAPTATTAATATTTTAAGTAATTTAAAAAASTSLLAPLTAPTTGASYPSFGALVQSGMLTGGDRVFLMDGYHGVLNLKDLKFTAPVTIAQMPGQTAQVEMIGVTNSSNIIMRDFKVWAMSANAGSGPLIRTYASSSNITIANLDVRSVADAGDYLTWSKTTWQANKRLGILLQGSNNSAIGNRLTATYHAIQTDGRNGSIIGNIIDGFSGDATRALGDDNVVRGNKMQNCFQIDANHADGVQSWSRGPTGTPGAGTVYNLTIENNKIYEWTASAPNALRCKLQGVGMFDGMFDGTVIDNNVVAVTGYHGISVAGALNTKIIHNTVVSASGQATTYPWIKISPHKNGTGSSNVTVANNVTNKIAAYTNATRNNLAVNNIVVKNAAAEFTSVANQDFTLLATAKSANAGVATYATPVDILGVARPRGAAPDAGAYESH